MKRQPIEAYCVDGVVCIPGDDGHLHLSRGFRVTAPETRAGSNRVRNRMCASLAQALGLLPEGGLMKLEFRISTDLESRIIPYAEATSASAPPAVQLYRNSKAIQLLKASRAGQLHREEVTLWVGQGLKRVKPSRAERKDLALFYAGLLANVGTEIAKIATPMQATLAPVGITLEALDSQAVAEAWYRTLNPDNSARRQTVVLPSDPSFSLTDDCWLSDLRGLGDRGFRLGSHYHTAFVLRRLAPLHYPGILDHFTTLPIPDFSLSVALKRLSKKKLMAEMQARLQTIQSQLRNSRNPALEVSARQIEEKLTQLASGVSVPLEMKLIVSLHAATEEELRQYSDLVKGAAARIGAQLYEAMLAASARDLFLLSLPGRLHSDDPCCVVYGDAECLAPLLPIPNTFEAHLHDAEALFRGRYLSLIGVRNFVGEGAASTPQHCFVSGMTGSGKSFFLTRFEIETDPYFGCSCVLDYGGSHRPYAEAVGASTLDITPDCPWTFNCWNSRGLPRSSSHLGLITSFVAEITGVLRDGGDAQDKLAVIEKHVRELCDDHADAWLRRQSEAERCRVARHALRVQQIVKERMCEPIEAFIVLRDALNAEDAAARQHLEQLTETEVRVFATKNRDAVRDLAFAYMEIFPTMSGLREKLDLAGDQDELCQRLADRLRRWTRGGSFGRLFDGQSTANFTGKMVHLNLGRMEKPAQELQSALWILLLIVLRQYCLSRPAAERKRIILEEVGRLMELPQAEKLIAEMFSTFRALNIQVTLVCQQIAQLGCERLRSIVLGGVRMAFIFHPGTAKDLDLISEHLPLSETAKATILKYAKPDQLRGSIYSECMYLHLTSGEPYCGTIRFQPIPSSMEKSQ
jgi:hypothetical protein